MEKKTFRNYEKPKNKVEQTYFENDRRETIDFGKEKQDQYLRLNHMKASVWDVIKILDNFIDESEIGFLHDLGKILSHFREPQWAVVGDTFPVGCAFESTNIHSDFFKENPDYLNPTYNTKYRIYSSKCGFDQLLMSFGHDEYLYHVMKPYLMLPYLKKFCSYDLYSKSSEPLIVSDVEEYYKDLISEFLPKEMNW
jgi:inositol oxygenase